MSSRQQSISITITSIQRNFYLQLHNIFKRRQDSQGVTPALFALQVDNKKMMACLVTNSDETLLSLG